MSEETVSELQYRQSSLQEQFNRIFQTLFWYDNLPENEQLTELVWKGNRLYREIRMLELRMNQIQGK